MSDALFGWELREVPIESTCDGCAEQKPLPYAWPETEAWLCSECWHYATEIDRERELSDRLAAALEDALANDGWGVRDRAETALVAWRAARTTKDTE